MKNLCVQGCLNPCFSGTCSPSNDPQCSCEKGYVLILVLVELALRVACINGERVTFVSLNPCFSGTCSPSGAGVCTAQDKSSLNPCFSGTCSPRQKNDDGSPRMSVLILVLVELALREQKSQSTIYQHLGTSFGGFPCFFARKNVPSRHKDMEKSQRAIHLGTTILQRPNQKNNVLRLCVMISTSIFCPITFIMRR